MSDDNREQENLNNNKHLTIELQNMKSEPNEQKNKKTDEHFFKYHQLTLCIHDYNLISSKKILTLIYIFLIIMYIGIQIGLMGVNFKSQDFIESNYYLPFHMLAFWAVFILTVLESLILIITGNVTQDDWINILQTVILLFNVVSTLSAAIIFSMFPAEYEVPAHYMEYSIQIFITLVDFLFIFKGSKTETNKWIIISKYIFAVLIFLLSLFQLLTYSAAVNVDMEPERAGHFMEFANEIANGLIALWFGFDQYYQISNNLLFHEHKMRDESINSTV